MAKLKTAIPSRFSRSLKNAVFGVAGSASLLVFSQVPSAKALPETGPAIGFNKPPTEGTVDSPPYVLGYHFTTDFDRKLVRLGIYKPKQGGVHRKSEDDHSVGIWDFSESLSPKLVWSQDFSKSLSCDESLVYFCWYDIADGPELIQNLDYVAAATWGDEPSPIRMPMDDVDVLISGFKLNTTASTQQGAVPGPNLLVDLNNPDYAPTESSYMLEKGFFTVNLSFETSSRTVQTPAPLPLIGAAAAFGWSRKIRRRINRST
jgi:hypothetical protein